MTLDISPASNHSGFVDAATRNYAAQVEQTALACDGRVERWNGVVLCDARSPHRYRNIAVPTQPLSSQESDDLADRLIEFYGAQRPWIVAALVPLVPTDGRLVVDIHEELMHFPGGAVDVPKIDGLEIREVATAHDMEEFERVWATAYEKPHLLEPSAVRYDGRILGGGQRLWLGCADGESVATSASFVRHGLNLVRGVTTLHSHRGRGIGRAMTLQAMAADECQRFLNAEPGIEDVYRRIGFNKVSTFTFWGLRDH